MGNQKNSNRARSTLRALKQRRKNVHNEPHNDEPMENDDATPPHTPVSQKPRDNERLITDLDCLEDMLNKTYEHSKMCTQKLQITNKSLMHLKLECTICDYTYLVLKDSKEHHLPVNDAFVVAAYCSGVGYSSLKTIFNCLESSFICEKTYRKSENRLGSKLQEIMKTNLSINLEKAKSHAIDNEEVIEVDNVRYPYTSVIVDGGWAKRSYGHSYSSNAGVAVIISEPLQKILHMGYRVKTCKVCDKNPEKDHSCFKNWNQSAQGMESDIIAKGFQKCYDTHGIIFKNLIGDADAAVHAKIQSTVVYPGRIPVNKIDCANHGVRGLNSRIHGILKNTAFAKKDRDAIRAQESRFGKDVRAAISYNHENLKSTPPTSAITLSEDILNVPRHVFGNHLKCKQYFCKGGGIDIYEEIETSPAGQELIRGFHLLANRAYKLIADTTTNRAELFMSIINKLISGKRINYAQRGGYGNRCCAAVLSYNIGKFWPASVLLSGREPCGVWKRTLRTIESEKKAQRKKPKKLWSHNCQKKAKASDGTHYGENATQGLLTDEEVRLGVSHLIASLQVTPENCIKIQSETLGQCLNDEWKFQRRNRITASVCGRIFRLKDSTNNSSTLKSLLYPMDLSRNENILRGINMEPKAREVYSFLYGVEVEECGLFISIENGILAASPDGLIGSDGILEIKSVSCKPVEVPLRRSSFLRFKDKARQELELKKTHFYYYQVITQLYVTGRSYCDFFVYFETEDSSNCEYFVERIVKSSDTDSLWSYMKAKLVKFYEHDVAPEIVDPTLPKLIPFRQPEYRQAAISAKLAEKAAKNN